MAGKLKPGELRDVLEALSGAARDLGSCLTSLQDCQEKLDKSIQCQGYLNYSLRPVQTGFVLKGNDASGPGASGQL